MKKSIFIFLIVFCTRLTIQAQELKLGLSGGFPIGDFSETKTFVLNADAVYVFEIAEQFEIGPLVSVIHFFGKQFNDAEFGGFQDGDPLLSNRNINLDDTTFLPIGATARFTASDSFILGIELGYGIGIAPERSESGLFYKAKGIYNLNDTLGVIASYAGININQGTFNFIILGIELSL